jgi:hypothetical protein
MIATPFFQVPYPSHSASPKTRLPSPIGFEIADEASKKVESIQ